LNAVTLSPNPWDLTLSGQNHFNYTETTWPEDMAPQGCDQSAEPRAGMAQDSFRHEAVLNKHKTRRTLAN
jgi:hypothetical protein